VNSRFADTLKKKHLDFTLLNGNKKVSFVQFTGLICGDVDPNLRRMFDGRFKRRHTLFEDEYPGLRVL
jgi:hypothetical protein